jgi:hypothetical protein
MCQAVLNYLLMTAKRINGSFIPFEINWLQYEAGRCQIAGRNWQLSALITRSPELLKPRIVEQLRQCDICHKEFTDYNEVEVSEGQKNPKGMGEPERRSPRQCGSRALVVQRGKRIDQSRRLTADQSAKFSDQHEIRLSRTRSVSVVCPIAGPSRKARSVYS